MDPLTTAKRKGCAVLGLGTSGTAAAEFLVSHGVTSLFLCDKNPEKARDPAVRNLLVRGATPRCGAEWLQGLPAGLLVRSRGPKEGETHAPQTSQGDKRPPLDRRS